MTQVDEKIVLKAKHIEKQFKNGDAVLKGIDLEIKEGTFNALLGPSGSGKTTLLNILSGALKPSKGSIFFDDKNIVALKSDELLDWIREKVGSVFQTYLLLGNLTVRENIEIGKIANKECIPIEELMKLLDIDALLDKFPSQLSGGEQQRVAIARAIIKKPEILFCDEVTGALDELNSKKVIDLLHQIKQKFGVTILFTTHNLEIAKTADRIITLKDGLLQKDIKNETPISAFEMNWE